MTKQMKGFLFISWKRLHLSFATFSFGAKKSRDSVNH